MKLKRLINYSLLTIGLNFFVFESTIAAERYLYRYQDNNGNTVLDYTVPPEFVNNGYSVLTESGRTIREVAPAPTAAEIAAREQIERAAKQQLEDTRFLRTYYSVNNVVRTRDKKFETLDIRIDIDSQALAELQKSYANYQKKAADAERLGQPISQDLQNKISHLDKQIRNVTKSLETLRDKRLEVEQKHAQIIKRLEDILAARNAANR